MSRIMGWGFVLLGVGAFAGVVCGAWWHLFTVGVCAVMAWGLFGEAKEEQGQVPGVSRG